MIRFLPLGYISLLFFAFVLALSLGGAPVFLDPDTAWHIAAGDLIRSLHSLPYYDSWSFTASDARWYNLSWLFDVGFSWLFEHGGFSALYALTLITFITALLLMMRYCVRQGASIQAVFTVTVLALFMMYNGVLARPNMASVLLTVIFYLVLQSYRLKRNAMTLFWLVPLMALWVNLHGGFLLAFVIMGLFFADAASKKDRPQARIYGYLIAACLIATLLNPYGLELYYGAWKTLGGAFDKNYINEWRAARVGAELPVTLVLLFVLCAGNFTDTRIALVDRVLTILMLMLSLCTVRHSAIAGLLIMPYLSQRLSLLLNESPWGPKVLAQHSAIMQDMQKPDIRMIGAAMAAAAVIFISMPALHDAVLKEPVGFPEDGFPVEEAAFIEDHYPHLRFYNDYNIGGYLDFLWRGRVKVFVDGRASSLYSPEVLDDYFTYFASRGYGLNGIIIPDQYRLDGLIIRNDNKDAGDWLWNPAWHLVFRGKVASVYLKSNLYESTKFTYSHQHPAHRPALMERIKKALTF